MPILEDETMEIIVYEMKYEKETVDSSNQLSCIPFEQNYFEEYMQIYNECFYSMRKSLEIEPYNFLNNYDQIANKIKDMYLLIENDEIIGSVACYGKEIDNLIVNKKFQRKGYGRQLLLWAMRHIREKNKEPITLHVAEWNQKAVELYQKTGFEISNIERVR